MDHNELNYEMYGIYCFKTIFLLNLHTLFEISRSYDKIIEILEREDAYDETYCSYCR